MAHPRAGQVADPSDLIDVDQVIGAYYDLVPDPPDPDQMVAFGTSGHRGSSLDTAFNEAHIASITQAIIEYRAGQGTTGPIFIAKDTHGLSLPAWKTAIEVLSAAGIAVLAERDDEYTPTPALSRAIIRYNREHAGGPQADGIVVTPSHNPPRDGGFKYNPPNGGPADTDATGWIADRANELMAAYKSIARTPYEQIAGQVARFDYRTPYCHELSQVINMDLIAQSGLRIGADPMGGASVQYWQYIAENLLANLTVVNPVVDPTWYFMTLDTDGKIRMDCSSPNAMASLVANRTAFDISTGNDADSDRHGIVTPDVGLMNPNHYLSVAIQYLFGNRPGWPHSAAIGKTLVSSSMIDNVAQLLGRQLIEVPVGFKWFVPGLISGEMGFGGEESAGDFSIGERGVENGGGVGGVCAGDGFVGVAEAVAINVLITVGLVSPVESVGGLVGAVLPIAILVEPEQVHRQPVRLDLRKLDSKLCQLLWRRVKLMRLVVRDAT